MPAVSPDSANRRYRIRTFLFMGGYVAVNVAAIFGAFDDLKPRAAVAFALVVSAPLIGHLWAFLAWMRESDEFVRGVATRRLVIASGITLAVCSVWGFMELYAKAPHVSPAMVVPLLWLAYGIVSPFIRTSH
jgi:hypothetical protein